MTEIQITLSSDYGYVVLVFTATWILLNWLESRVFQARRRYEVPVSGEYGYVVLVFVATIFLLQWLGIRVGMARKKHEVPYPKMYTEPYGHVFNCIQRAHQNTLEGYPMFLVLMFLGGLLYPKLSAACGVVWIASRVMYALGYYSGDPERRKYGAFGYIGLLILLVINVILGLKMLGVVSM